MTDSPLKEVDPQALEELYARDPEDLTEKDLESMVSILRTQRSEFCKKDDEAHKKGKYGKGPKRELNSSIKTIYDINLD